MLKRNKYILVLFIILAIFCSISTISANNINNTTNTNNGDQAITTDSQINTHNIQNDKISSYKSEINSENKENVSSYKSSDTTIYLNSSYQGKDSDGSQNKPYTNLQSALNYKDLNTGWTINIAPGTYSGENNRGQNISNNNLTISKWANTNGEIIFDGEHQNRIIYHVGTGTLSLNELTFINGYSKEDKNQTQFPGQGGAIFSCNGTINLDKCNFINNYGALDCGAIFASKINANNSKFINNQAKEVGALATNKATNINNCTFINNKAKDGNGGAIEFEIGTITNSTFINNSANYLGGAIFFPFNKNCNISHCLFINNIAKEGKGNYGNDVCANNLTMNYCILINNQTTNSIFTEYYQGNTNFWGKNFQNKEEFINSKLILITINDPPISPDSWVNMNIEGGLTNSTNGNYKITLNTLNNGKTLKENLPDYTVNLKSNGTITPNPITIKNGTASFNYTGNHGDIIYAQDQYNNTITNKTVATKTMITGTNFNETYNNKKQFTINLTDTNKKPIAKQTIYFNLFNALGENKTYTATTNENGTASLPINLIKGNYNINCYFLGNNQYSSTNKHNTITIKPIEAKLSPNPFNEKYQAQKNFTVNFTTTNGTPIIGAEIQLTLYNTYNQTKTYWKTTNTEGQAKLPIELIPANWKIECNYPNTSYNTQPINKTITVY